MDWMACEGINPVRNPPAPIALWTEASTKADPKTKPLPRSRGFMLNRHATVKRDKELSRGKLKNDISKLDSEAFGKLSENQLNWSCYLHGLEALQPTDIWGYEIPLAAESAGQLKVDLLKIRPNVQSETPSADVEIVELKKADGSNSPVEALVQSICYLCQLSRCWEYLTKTKEAASLQDIPWNRSSVRLILAAPDAYWKKWKFRQDDAKNMLKIVKSVRDALDQERRPSRLELTFANVKKTEDGRHCRLETIPDLDNTARDKDSILSL